HILLGETLMLRGRAAEADASFAKARDVAPDDPTIQRRLETSLHYGMASLDLGRADAALAIARRAIEARAAIHGEDSYEVAKVRGLSAIALFELNDRPAAIAAFRRALPPLLARQGDPGESIESPQRRILQWLFEHFLELLSDHGRGISDSAALD